MICVPCREREHDKCKGNTWCDCQHVTEERLRAGLRSHGLLDEVNEEDIAEVMELIRRST